MVPFSMDDSDRFFGRNEEIEELLECLRLHPFMTAIGPSGSGKSSLVFAGLIPALRRSGRFGSGDWLVRTMRPGDTPLAALKTTLGSDLANPALAVTETLAAQPHAQRLLLVIDQFEEVFTLTGQEAVPFQQALLHLAETPNCYLILTVRADFYPELMGSPLWQKIKSHRLEVVPLDEAGLREAIIRPAEDVGVFVEPALLERLIADAAGEPGVLPLIQETLVLLWEKVERRFLPLRAYEALVLPRKAYGALGNNKHTGLQVAIARRADAAIADLSEEQQAIARRIFLRLIQFGEGRADTRRQQPIDALRATGENPRLFDQTLRHLADCRLLTLSGGEKDSSRKADIAHEALISGWPALQQWLTELREAEQPRRRLAAQAEEWVRLGKGSAGLLDEFELAEAERWLNRPDVVGYLGYDEDLSALVEASSRAIQQARDRELNLIREKLDQERKARKAAQTRNVIATFAAVILALLAAVAGFQSINAQLKAIETISASSEAIFASNKQLEALVESIRAGKLLKRLAWANSDTKVKVTAVLRQVVYEIREQNRLEGHKDWVTVASFSPDGKTIVTASEDGTIKLWRDNGTFIRELKGHNGGVLNISFNSDGHEIASASADKSIKIWKLDGTLVKTLEGHQDKVFAIAFSFNNEIIASASADDTIKLWDRNGKLIKILKGHQDDVLDISFNPKEKVIASASTDDTIKLWDWDGKLINSFQIAQKGVLGVSFDPDGKTLVSAGKNGTVKLWDTKGKLLQTFQGHTDSVQSVRFSPDGKTIASAGKDRTVRLWSRNGQLLQILQGHANSVSSVRFSPDGKTIASASLDKTVKLWNSDGISVTKLRGQYVRFSPNGKILASVVEDKIVQLWRSDGIKLNKIEGHRDFIHEVSFSPNSEMLATASKDGTVKLWRLNGKLRSTLPKQEGAVYSVSFSPNGEMLASAGKDGIVKLWSLDGKLLQTFKGHEGSVRRVIFSPDGKILASASDDNTVRLWHRNGQLFQTLQGHKGGVLDVSFSPDGKVIASASDDNTVRLWYHSGQFIQSLQDHSNSVLSVTFSPDSQIIASASADNTIKLWNSHGRLLRILKQGDTSVSGVSFSPDGKLIALADFDGNVILLNFDLVDLLTRGCAWLHDYLETNPSIDERDRSLCHNITD
jgi:WD40 repeat protein